MGLEEFKASWDMKADLPRALQQNAAEMVQQWRLAVLVEPRKALA